MSDGRLTAFCLAEQDGLVHLVGNLLPEVRLEERGQLWVQAVMGEDQECHSLLKIIEEDLVCRSSWREVLCRKVQGGGNIASIALADEFNQLQPKKGKVQL